MLSVETPDDRANVCLVAHFALGALTGGTGYIGGVERQTSLMAKWLASRGHRVSFLTWDEGQSDGLDVDGVRVFKMCRHEEGIAGLRFIHPRWTSLAGAMARANAAVYYQNCGEAITGQIGLWCGLRRREFVYSVAADSDCDPILPFMDVRERVLYRIGLRHAARIIVQTGKQRRMLAEGFGLDSMVVPMPCPGPNADFETPAAPSTASPRVLWLARITRAKRPDRLVTIARECPDLHFDVVGPSDGSDWTRDVLAILATLPNVTLHGMASRDQVSTFYRHSSCLLSTSDYEGFPNTYLEAWSHGIPVVTLFDPDDLVKARALGVAALDPNELPQAVRGLLLDDARWHELSANARRYYLANHTLDAVMERFEQIFVERTLAQRSARQTRGRW